MDMLYISIGILWKERLRHTARHPQKLILNWNASKSYLTRTYSSVSQCFQDASQNTKVLFRAISHSFDNWNECCGWERFHMMTSSKGNILGVPGLLWKNPQVTGGFPSYKRPVTRSFMFSSLCAWTNGWANSRDAVDLRRHGDHSGVTVMEFLSFKWVLKRYASPITPLQYTESEITGSQGIIENNCRVNCNHSLAFGSWCWENTEILQRPEP